MDGQQVDELAELLDQCSPDELASILNSIEGSDKDAIPGIAPMAPVPPSSPPPKGNGRRPVPNGVKQAEAGIGDFDRQDMMAEVQMLLEEQSAGMLSEVRKLMPNLGSVDEAVDMGTLAKALSDRDSELQGLEAHLAALQADLAGKDKRVAELGSALELSMREVRHRQLDLEFQQLKLEERVRSNAELENQQRNLSARVEEASLNARHAAIDSAAMTPRGQLRAQGQLPWVLRKQRIGMQ